MSRRNKSEYETNIAASATPFTKQPNPTLLLQQIWKYHHRPQFQNQFQNRRQYQFKRRSQKQTNKQTNKHKEKKLAKKERN